MLTKVQATILAQLEDDPCINSEQIEKLISDFSPIAKSLQEKYERYKASKLPIDDREFTDKDKVNNKIKNDYRGTIVDQAIGYFLGKPITYQIDKNKYSENDYEKYATELSNFITENSFEDLDMESGKIAAICGYSARLLYIDLEGKPSIMNLKPWEVILFEDSKERVNYALRFYTTYDKEGKEIVKVEWYDNSHIHHFTKKDNGYVEEIKEEHLFEEVPLLKIKNNEEEQGDFEKVESLIDAYDRVISDSQNEIEEFRQAYMVFENCEIDKDAKAAAKQTGAFSLPDGGQASFLVKAINTEFYVEQKKTLSDNIYKFAKAVDMADEKFSGSSQSGESRRWKLIDLENKAIVKENKFKKTLRKQFKLICSVWNKKDSLGIDYLSIFFEFHRSLPQDLAYLADVSQKFKGTISERTRLSILPFVDDVDYELKLMEKENTTIPLDDEVFEDNNGE